MSNIQDLLSNNHPLPHHEMIFVRGGTFLMGSEDEDAFEREQPLHEVELSDFYIGQYPVTQALWKAIMGEGNKPSYFRGDSRPVESINWQDAQDFIQKLNDKTKPKAGWQYRLPTEAEWEYAARGGRLSRGYKYAGSDKLEEVGWYGGKSHDESKPVGLKDPNELGLYDMSGNVFEWCHDWFDEKYYGQCKKSEAGGVKNPGGPQEGTSRVVRGGDWWYDNARDCRPTYRTYNPPENRFSSIGFRLVFSLQSVG